MPVLHEPDSQSRPDPAAPHDDDVHSTNATRPLPPKTILLHQGPLSCLGGNRADGGEFRADRCRQPGLCTDSRLPAPLEESGSRRFVPEALPSPDNVVLPETLRYRLKNALLGPPLATERQAVERLGKLAGLGVLAPDMISSSAYGTEQMLTQLVPWFGLAAFSLVVPVTFVI